MHALILSVLMGCSPESATTDSVELSSDTGTSIGDETRFVPMAEDGLSVEAVDPARYLGLWYEIATSPSQQGAACTGTTAEYSLVDESTIGVTNRCFLGSLEGRVSRIDGTARPIDDTYARLLVDLGFGFEAPYTVVDLMEPPGDEPYSVAVVSAAGFQYWVLSRTPQIADDLYADLLERLDERGGDSSELILTEQPAVGND
jgi:lipocalin